MQKLDIFIALASTSESGSRSPGNPAKHEHVLDVTLKFEQGILNSITKLKSGWACNKTLKIFCVELPNFL